MAHGSRSRRRTARRTTTRRHRRRRAAADWVDCDRVELPGLELERGELVVVVGERGVEVRIVRRRAAVDRHEVGEVAPPGPAQGPELRFKPSAQVVRAWGGQIYDRQSGPGN